MPERFEIYRVYKKRYINTLPFLFLFLTQKALENRFQGTKYMRKKLQYSSCILINLKARQLRLLITIDRSDDDSDGDPG